MPGGLGIEPSEDVERFENKPKLKRSEIMDIKIIWDEREDKCDENIIEDIVIYCELWHFFCVGFLCVQQF